MKEKFIAWYFNSFVFDPLFAPMTVTKEDSPWHREESVSIHTNMVVTSYIAQTGSKDNFDLFWLIGALACAFHDTGKPSAKARKYKPERGHYNAFHGHELISARLWEDWAIRNFDTLMEMSDGEFTKEAIMAVTWIIEHHLPWEYAEKSQVLQNRYHQARWTQRFLFGRFTTFTDALLADSAGRISDDWNQKMEKSRQWVHDFNNYTGPHRDYEAVRGDKEIHILIGASGSGKSTTRTTLLLQNKDAVPFSLDDLRLELFSPDDYSIAGYKKAFKASVESSTFTADANAKFSALIKQGKSIVVDNTNVSMKSRRFYLDTAKRNGYRCIAHTFPASVGELIERQHTRTDKFLDVETVMRQYMSVSQPSIGEFDAIRVHW